MIYIVIPVFNRIHSTLKCIKSIVDQNLENISIIVVNDGSTDSTVELIAEIFPEIVVLNGTGSLFWTGAVHYGINYILKTAKIDDWILLVNNDVYFEGDTITKLLDIGLRCNRRALVSALTLDAIDRDKVVVTGSIVKSWFFNITKHIYSGLSFGRIHNNELISVDFLTARCLLHPIEVFYQAGNYDSIHFPHYGGDDEFSQRAKGFGYQLLVFTGAQVYLDTRPNRHRKSFKSVFSFLYFELFDRRSNINIRDAYYLAIYIVPYYSRLSYFLISIIKKLITACLRI